MRPMRSRTTTPRGMAAPMTNAPKTACNPIRSVKHAPSAISASANDEPGFVERAILDQPCLGTGQQVVARLAK